VLRLVEEMEISAKTEVGRSRKTWKDIGEEGFGTNGSGRECGIGWRIMEKDHQKSDPCLKGTYRL